MVRELLRAPRLPVDTPPPTDKKVIAQVKAFAGTEAMSWILHELCRATDNPYYPSDRDTAFACGKAFVGQALLGLINVSNDALKDLK